MNSVISVCGSLWGQLQPRSSTRRFTTYENCRNLVNLTSQERPRQFSDGQPLLENPGNIVGNSTGHFLPLVTHDQAHGVKVFFAIGEVILWITENMNLWYFVVNTDSMA